MSDDEIFVLIVSGIIAVIGWVMYYSRLAGLTRLGGGMGNRICLAVFPGLGAVGILLTLMLGASYDVRASGTYLSFYLLLGLAWMRVSGWAMGLLGIFWRDDALERRNLSATLAIAGAWLGLAACYAGGNIGDGPGWWCVVYASGLATLAWFGLWAVVQWLGDVAERVTIDRDLATGIRLGGLLLALGLVCGRAAAGDWVSASATSADLVLAAWPALLLAVGAGLIERWAGGYAWRPGERRGPWLRLGEDVVVALLYLLAAGVIIYLAGPLSENPAWDEAWGL